MLATLNDVLKVANDTNTAIGAINCTTLEMAEAAVMAAEELNVPLILQHSQAHEDMNIAKMEKIIPMFLVAAKLAKVPVCVHLDHGSDRDYVLRAIRLGVTSVMYDASVKPFDVNVAETASVVAAAHAMGVQVEAEIGAMPSSVGGESIDEEAASKLDSSAFYTDPDSAARFAELTKVDALAISFGTVHGVYTQKPNINVDVVSSIASKISTPLVMHGGSGVSTEDYKRVIAAGIRKINYYTYMALAGGKATEELVKENNGKLLYHDVALRAVSAMKDDVFKALKVFSGK